jgi:hypothetical protein
LHQIHHSARRLEILTSFYKHPVEIWINSLLSSLIVFPLFGCSVEAVSYYTLFIALGEFFIIGTLRHPAGSVTFSSGRNPIACTINSGITPIISATCRSGTCFGTFRNPAKFRGRCGYEDWREDRFDDMVAFRDVHAPSVEKSAPLHFLPSCIGCSKRWACTAANEPRSFSLSRSAFIS